MSILNCNKKALGDCIYLRQRVIIRKCLSGGVPSTHQASSQYLHAYGWNASIVSLLHILCKNKWLHALIYVYKWIAHPATKVKPPECQTAMTLFILILNLVLTLKKTNSFSLCLIRRNFPSHKIRKSPKKSANKSSVKLFI